MWLYKDWITLHTGQTGHGTCPTYLNELSSISSSIALRRQCLCTVATTPYNLATSMTETENPCACSLQIKQYRANEQVLEKHAKSSSSCAVVASKLPSLHRCPQNNAPLLLHLKHWLKTFHAISLAKGMYERLYLQHCKKKATVIAFL